MQSIHLIGPCSVGFFILTLQNTLLLPYPQSYFYKETISQICLSLLIQLTTISPIQQSVLQYISASSFLSKSFSIQKQLISL
jgi:hypothetical protein